MWLVLPVFYVLSMGPAGWMYNNIESVGLQDGLDAFYAPLLYLIENEVPGVGPALNWYIELFAL